MLNESKTFERIFTAELNLSRSEPQRTVLIIKILLNLSSISVRAKIHLGHFIDGLLGMYAPPIRYGALTPTFMVFSSMIWQWTLSKHAIWTCVKTIPVVMVKNVYQHGMEPMLGILVMEVNIIFIIFYSYCINCIYIDSKSNLC